MILNINGTPTEIAVDDSSYRYRAIMGENSLTLNFTMEGYIDVPVGSYADFGGERYTLTKPQNFKKNNTWSYEYTLVLDGAQKQLDKYKFRNTMDGTLKFSVTGKPQDHLAMLIANMNLRDSGWSAGQYIDAPKKTISYSHSFCLEALQSMAEAFGTEWEVAGKTISLRKVEYNRSTPLALSYGKGNGFKTGVVRSNADNSRAIEILYVQGGSRNIDPTKYGSKELLLPRSQQYTYEGRTYITDAAGLYIKREDKALSSHEEESLDLSNIYPSRIGNVSAVVVVDEKKNFYDFTDTSIPEALDFSKAVTAGEAMTIIFQTGMLAGRELEASYDHEHRNFKLVPQEIDGMTMPNNTFMPHPGDEYAVFNIQLPSAYICDDATQSGASWDLFKQACKFLYENEDPRFSFSGELDGIWAKERWADIQYRIRLGGFVAFTDSQFQTTPALIRIIGIKELINNPYKPQIELSNVTTGRGIASSLAKIETNEVMAERLQKDAVQYTRRRFRDAKETIEMLEGAFDNFTGGISPVSVRTMAMLVGDESLQFNFLNGGALSYDPETQKIKATEGSIQHMTIGIDNISSEHKEEEYHTWSLPDFESGALGDLAAEYDAMHPEDTIGQRYYLYINAPKDNENGPVQAANYFLSKTTLPFETDTAYNLLVAGINSEYANDRSIAQLNGFTEILPGRITTDKVISSDGQNYMDFVSNSFRIGDEISSLEWNKDASGQLILRGTLVQSAGGTTAPIGVWRGDWNTINQYYPGDEFAFDGSSYITTALPPSAGVMPTDTRYFKVKAAKGADGADGVIGKDGKDGTSLVFKGEFVTAPSNPQNGWMYKNTTTERTYVYQDGAWYQMTADGLDGTNGLDGINGKDGKDGLSIVYKGDLSVPPANPQLNEVYRDTDNGVVYIYNGTGWQLMISDGNDGAAGTNGSNGLSVFITYNDNVATLTPSLPTGDGTTGGWHTNPTATSVWISQKVAASASSGTWGTPIRIKGTDGINGVNGTNGKDGAAGDYYEYQYAKNGSKTTPPTLSTTSLNPSGWSTSLPILGTLEYCWMTVGKKNGTGTTLLANWSTPVRISAVDGINGINGTNGTNGATGDYFESRYFKNTTPSTPPNAPTSMALDPVGWTIAPPAIATNEYLWVSVCKKNGAGTQVLMDWSSPVRSTGLNGANGTNGAIGPSAVFRGLYDQAKTYYGNMARVDIVEYAGAYYVARSDAGSFSWVTPTDSSKWNGFGSQFDSVATALLFAQMAYVDNLAVRYFQTAPDGSRITMDGNTIHFYGANNIEVARIENGQFIGIGALLQNATFRSNSSASSVDISGGSICFSESNGGDYNPTQKTVDIGATGIDLYQLLGGATKHIHVHNIGGETLIDGESVTTPTLNAKIASHDYIKFRALSQTEVNALAPLTLYVGPTGKIAAKDAYGTSHDLW